ncbi:hypothetical protein M407DRAFT_7531 [Tulasnella calospora MUT 4182]|uniref:Uncharacterized protein n=1 Tax=Tulasnella calospora MUT 4182 TaxID=1051891 RepID=A0A0C3LZX3_9AGAM|nr:hypothetical protein M407DRAFT_7531 [Tulasnella calospora MUT 4182]
MLNTEVLEAVKHRYLDALKVFEIGIQSSDKPAQKPYQRQGSATGPGIAETERPALYIQIEKLSGVVDLSSWLRAPACQEITLGGGPLWDEVPLHLPDALTRAVGHFIPVIRSKLVPGERVIIVADEALNYLHTPNVKLSVAANIRSSCPATQVPHWMIDNIPDKEADIALDVRLSGPDSEELVSLVSRGRPLYLTTLGLSEANDGGYSVVEYLSRPASSPGGAGQWPLPCLISLTVWCYRDCLPSLLQMLRARAGGAGDTDITRPLSLKTLEIRYYGRKPAVGTALWLELERLMQETGGSLSYSEGW